MFYIGSCRYMYEYGWNHFRARLHTTREIIHFLENIHEIHKMVERTPMDLNNIIFGDLFHPAVIHRTPTYIKDGTDNLKEVKKLVLEVSSRKLYYYKNIPLNYYNSGYDPTHMTKYGFVFKELSDSEMVGDFIRIKQLSTEIFHKDVSIHIIPHLNLKLKGTDSYIPKRAAFVRFLMVISNHLGFHCHNIGMFLELIKKEDAFLEHYMEDHHHYSNNYQYVKAFLTHSICNSKPLTPVSETA